MHLDKYAMLEFLRVLETFKYTTTTTLVSHFNHQGTVDEKVSAPFSQVTILVISTLNSLDLDLDLDAHAYQYLHKRHKYT